MLYHFRMFTHPFMLCFTVQYVSKMFMAPETVLSAPPMDLTSVTLMGAPKEAFMMLLAKDVWVSPSQKSFI